MKLTSVNGLPNIVGIPAVILLVILTVSGLAYPDPGVTEKTITLGQSCALTGPARPIGMGMKAGLDAAFEEINTHGGVNGRRIFLVTRDDYYEPGQASRNTQKLILQDKVFLLIGQVGTPTSKAALSIAEKFDIPFFAPYTGAVFLRTPFNRNIINLRAGYDQEMKHLVSYLMTQKNIRRVACFFQDDSFGYAGLIGLEKALTSFGLELVGKGSFQRNTVAVLAGLNAIRKASPEAVVLVGTHPPCAEFINLARARGMADTTFAAISFVDAMSLARLVGSRDKDVIVSQVLPHPWAEDLPITRDYRNAMALYQPRSEISYSSFEGYVAGRLFIYSIKALTGAPTRDGLIKTVETFRDIDLGGLTIQFGPEDHQGMDRTYLLKIRNRELVPLP